LNKIFARKECWALTIYGKLLFISLLGLVTWLCVIGIHPFLAETNRISAKILVIEGWLQPISLREAAVEFVQGNYEKALLIQYVTGKEDQNDTGRYCGEYKSSWLIKHGIGKDQLTTILVNIASKDRTYNAALIVKKWLADNGLSMKPINVVTMGAHARRSYLLYRKVFGESGLVGIIDIKNKEYDPAHWWRTSAGFREVIGELIAFLYAKFFFYATP
jgi:hypothetical protein